jgi:hypothetical protein
MNDFRLYNILAAIEEVGMEEVMVNPEFRYKTAFRAVLLDDRVRAIGATFKNTLPLPGSEELEVFTC